MLQRYGDMRKALTCKPVQNAETKTVWKENARECAPSTQNKPEEVRLHDLFGLFNLEHRLVTLYIPLMPIQLM